MSPITDTKAALRTLARSQGRILVGPWLGEIGFELLYWIPFLRWAMRVGGLDPARLLVVSRGGVESWYRDLWAPYVDLFDHFTPAEFIAGNERRILEQTEKGGLGLRRGKRIGKQYIVSTFDETIREAVQPVGEPRLQFLHPSLMFGIFRNFWRGIIGQDPYRACTKVARLHPPATLAGLPSRYVAMKWYVSNACQDRPQTRRAVQQIVEQITRHTDVVLLHSGTRYDDHGEFPIPADPRVHLVPMEPRTNLTTQTAVIGGATSFIGTYGGFAYLAPFLGVPTLGIYTDANFHRNHLSLMQTAAIVHLHTPCEVVSLHEAVAQGGWGAYAA